MHSKSGVLVLREVRHFISWSGVHLRGVFKIGDLGCVFSLPGYSASHLHAFEVEIRC